VALAMLSSPNDVLCPCPISQARKRISRDLVDGRLRLRGDPFEFSRSKCCAVSNMAAVVTWWLHHESAGSTLIRAGQDEQLLS
jgi:hypothetical protein